MKSCYPLLATLALLAFFLTPGLLRAQDDPNDDQGVSFQAFYDQLGDQGTWVQTDDYGYVFQPSVTDPDWAPYTDGHWVYTDEGWTWVSDEPWGWATYHYGRWANIDGTGWVWVPGYEWAPAWVSWRYGDGYAGWAPLPPETFVGAEFGDPGVAVGIGFHFGGDVDVNFNIGAGCYNFVRIGDLGERNYRGRYVNRYDNFRIINNTTNITNINVNRGGRDGRNDRGGFGANFRGVTAGGPPINEVNAHSRQHIQTVNLAAANQPGRSTLQGNTLTVFAPRVDPATLHQARPAAVNRTINHPTFNRGDSVNKPLAVTASVQPAPPSPQAIQAAQQAQAHIPAHARIATEATPVHPAFTKPLSSLEPVVQVHNTAQAQGQGSPGPNGTNPNHRTDAAVAQQSQADVNQMRAQQIQAQHDQLIHNQQQNERPQQVQPQPQVPTQQPGQPSAQANVDQMRAQQIQAQQQAVRQQQTQAPEQQIHAQQAQVQQAQAAHQPPQGQPQGQAPQPQAKGNGQNGQAAPNGNNDKKKLPGQQ